MKKTISISILVVSFFMATCQSFNYYRITAGASVTVSPQNIPDVMLIYSSGPVTLASDWEINLTSTLPAGRMFKAIISIQQVDRNGHDIKFFGYTLTDNQINKIGYYEATYVSDHSGGVIGVYNYAPYDLAADSVLGGNVLIDGSVPLSKLEGDIPLSILDTVTRGRILVGNSSNELSSYYAAGSAKILIGDGSDVLSKSVTGDITLTSGAVTYLDSATVRDSSIATGAAIKWQKLATGTASYVAVTNASGVLTTEQYLQPVRGGTGINSSMSTGVVTVNGGTWAIGVRTEVLLLQVSFESGYAGDFKITMPFAGTVTGIYAYAIKAIAGTDNGTIQMKNNAGTSTTNGLITFTASDTRGTAYSVSPSANNTFVANDILTFTTAKTTAGGVVQLSITYTRAN